MAPPPSPSSPPDADELAWEVALDLLELDVVSAERLLSGESALDLGPWRVPDLATPIPAVLLPRAVELHRRQQAAQVALKQAVSSNERHRAFTERVHGSSPTGLGSPAYVDVTA